MIYTEKNIIRFEEMALNAWPALKNTYFMGSVLRYSNGYTKRANSVNALYQRRGINKLIAFAEQYYKGLKAPVVFKVIDCKQYRRLDRKLENLQYQKKDTTTIKTLDLEQLEIVPPPEVTVANSFSEKWITGLACCNNLRSKKAVIARLLKSIAVDTLVASIQIDNEPVAFGYAALENNCAGFFDVVVDEAHRGKGYGRKIMEGLLAAAQKSGIQYGYLQVMDNNAVANKLYDSLGFREYYKYWYRVK